MLNEWSDVPTSSTLFGERSELSRCTKARLLTFRTRASKEEGQGPRSCCFIPLSFAAGGQWTCWWRGGGALHCWRGGKRGSGRGDLCVLLSSHPESSLRSSAAFQRCAVMLGSQGRNLLSSVMLNHTGAGTLSRTRSTLSPEEPLYLSLGGLTVQELSVPKERPYSHGWDGAGLHQVRTTKVICQFSGCDALTSSFYFVFYLEGVCNFYTHCPPLIHPSSRADCAPGCSLTSTIRGI